MDRITSDGTHLTHSTAQAAERTVGVYRKVGIPTRSIVVLRLKGRVVPNVVWERLLAEKTQWSLLEAGSFL